MNSTCPFCEPSQLKILAEDELTMTIKEKRPISPGHLLVITRRHVPSFFDVTKEEQQALFKAVSAAHDQFYKNANPSGFNVGVNQGADAGQSVFHVHVHLIPRFHGDTPDPRGGVKRCLPWPHGNGHAFQD
jgi:diadenosine tetraphosphate (Ap4A) HIT family hydrolase